MSKRIHLIHGMILLSSWLRTSNTANPKIANRSGVKRREQTARCIDWPPKDPGLLLFARDGSAPICGPANDLLIDTWNTSTEANAVLRRRTNRMDFSPEPTTIVDVTDDGLGIDCSQYPKAQIVQLIQVSTPSTLYDKILECAAYKGPHVAFINPPLVAFPQFIDNDDDALDDALDFDPFDDDEFKRFSDDRQSRGISKIILAELVDAYAPCVDVGDDCIIPETFRISNDQTECEIFFNLLDTDPSFAGQWILKPTRGYGGDGIKLVQDIQTELKDPYGSCDGNYTAPRVVVQRYVQPYLIDGHAFHFRTYFLIKRRNKDKNDPTQAWRIDAGNFFICSEPYSQRDHPYLGPFAFICNKFPWLNPRASRRQWVLSFNEAKEMFSSDIWDLILENVARVFNGLAFILDQYSKESRYNVVTNETAAWTVFAADLVINDDYRVWLLDLNLCYKNPWEYDPDNIKAEWNPYISILRIVLSHYRRVLLNDDTIDEAACSSIALSTTVRQVYPNI